MRSIDGRPLLDNDLLPLVGRVELRGRWFDEGRGGTPLLVELAPLANLIPDEVP
jgi:hypothetical protein